MPGGLIRNQMSNTTQQDDNVQSADTTNYDADTRTVDQNRETVSGQLNTLLDNDSPVMQRAAAGATQAANARGLINSSMAAEAGQAAVIDAALPIASHDADTYTTASRDNQQATNTSRQYNASETNANARFNAGESNQTARIGVAGAQERLTSAQQSQQAESLARVQGSIQSGLSQQQAIQQEAQQRLDGEIRAGLITTQAQQNERLAQIQGDIEQQLANTRTEGQSRLQSEAATQTQALETLRGQVETQLQTLRGGQAENLANIEANYRGLIQGNASASQLFTQAITMLSAIMGDYNTSADQKQNAVNAVSQMLESGLGVIGSMANVDLSSLLTFDFTVPTTGGTTTAPTTDTTGGTTTTPSNDNLNNGIGP